ncbi:MAG: hypothetical protein KGN84_22875 [Acidobacteriota bacterium]|nr:hypothetical protein [Acidobacteriota bacterium]
MRYVLSNRRPQGTRILFVESGSRGLIETVLPILTSTWAANYTIDVITCFGGVPEGLTAESAIYRVGDYATPEKRDALVKELRSRGYAYLGIVCSAEPIMTKWKWMLAFRIPARVFVVNENADYFWMHRENASILRQFALVRAGLHGADAPRTLARLLFFPFAVIFLLLYAAQAHTRRLLHR